MSERLYLLLIDDDNVFAGDLMLLGKELFDIKHATTGEDGLAYLRHEEPDAVLLDLCLGAGMDGMETLKKMREKYPDLPVLMITSHESVDTAVEAMKLGAIHYASKRPNVQELAFIIERELKSTAWKKLYQQQYRHHYGRMIGDSAIMHALYQTISRIAPNSATVLITGEPGVGKELVAHEIHARSGRAHAPFIAVNCGAVPDTLFESELFGHEKGSFTGAYNRQLGKFELAEGGTLFLDEIANLSLINQGKLLRVLEEHFIQRLGGSTSIPVNVRVVAATNQDLLQACEQERFRRDLYYRISTLQVSVPALRQRRQDIPLLLAYFVKQIMVKMVQKGPGFSEKAVQAMCHYDWPGNVRELRNIVERLLTMIPDRTIEAADLLLHQDIKQSRGLFDDLWELPYIQARKKAILEFQKEYFQRQLERHNGSITKAAAAAGVARSTLHRRFGNGNLLS
jgi:two-component system, NtrC family, nitrogen regulation response regulator NtrX